MALRSFRAVTAEIWRQGRYLEHQQQCRHGSVGDFFKRLKSEAEKNPELQKSIDELRKSGEAFRERSKSVSQAVSEAATASAEAARSATAGLRQQAEQATSSVQESVSQASKGVRDSLSSQFKQDAQGTQAQGTSTSRPAASSPTTATGTSATQPRGPPEQTSASEGPISPGTPSDTQQQQQQAFGGPEAPASQGSSSSQQQQQQEQGPGAGTGAGPSGAGHQQQQQEQQAGSQGSTAGEGPGQSKARQRSESLMSRVRRVAGVVRAEVAAAINPEDAVKSATRASGVQERKAGSGGPSALMAVSPSRWSQHWQYLEDKLGLHPLFRRMRALRDHKVVNRGREMAEDFQARWETSDSPLVQRMQEVKDRMFSETEMARAYKEIAVRDPRFDMVLFLQRLKKDVPVVVKGSLEGNKPVLKEHCAPEMVERFSGIHNAKTQQGLFEDTTILDWSDVELVDVRLHEADPMILVQFTCQHINCTRDKHGNVIEGSPSNVERKFYFWAVQQDPRGFVGIDGNAYPPRWQLREQAVSAAQNLL